MQRTNEIKAQRAHGLITTAEARIMLDALARWSDFSATYADDPKAYARYSREAHAARQALQVVR